MAETRVLLAGESWVTYAIHQKGFNAFTTGTYAEGHGPLTGALRERGVEVTYLNSSQAVDRFPREPAGFKEYDVVILSDIGSDTLRLHPDTFSRSIPTPDRLKLIRGYVENGGGFLMVGGYLSFQGYGGAAHYRFTPIEEILPVELLAGDDRVELPEGFHPRVVADHDILKGLPGDWPILLGYNKVKPTGQVLLKAEGNDPLLIVGEYGRGRTAAFTSDLSPHWGSPDFTGWKGYGDFWFQLVRWLAG
jgi:uncharacterized membrane protein